MLSDLAPWVSARHAYLATVLEVLGLERFVPVGAARGRRRRDAEAFARAFAVKALLGISETKDLRLRLLSDEALRSLCGFWRGVPSESTFSRSFARMAACGFGDAALERLAKDAVSDSVVTHVARDSTAIHARERPLAKPKAPKAPRRKPGRKKGIPPGAKTPKRQERQSEQDPREALAELPKACDVGTKRNSKGHDVHWIGYKLHADVCRDGLPLAAFTTSASVHDSQVAIPLMKLTAERAGAVLYQLMDAAYVGKPIVSVARAMGQVAIVAPKGAAGRPAVPLDPAIAERYRLRTAVERFFSDLKDNRAADWVRVRGHAKVHLHLMFALLAVMGAKLVAG